MDRTGRSAQPVQIRHDVEVVADGPQYSVEFRNWKTGDEAVKDDSFAFKNATNAEKIDLKDLQDKIE